MSQWYCHVDGQQYGPIGQEELRSWAAQGRLRPTDKVWKEGMAEWVAASTVEGLFSAGGAAALAPGALVACAPPGGTRGRTPNAQLTRQARELLRGRWGLPIGFSFLLSLLVVATGVVPYVGPLILGGPLVLGGAIFYLTFVRKGECQLGMLFSGFQAFGKALGTYLLQVLFLFLWALPFYVMLMVTIFVCVALAKTGEEEAAAAAGVLLGLVTLVLLIPPVIAGLRYSQAFYLVADDSTIGCLQAIHTSKEMMRGYKGKLFCLGLRYFCWSLLVVLAGAVTCGIGAIVGSLFLGPYMAVGYARFYDDLRGPAGEPAQATAPASTERGMR